MKKLLIITAALFALGTTQAQQQCVANCVSAPQVFPDIPAGHWANEAVDRITDLGIIIGFPDGTFRGNETLTRYQAALMFDRLINLLNANLASMQAVSDADREALRLAIESLTGQVAGLAQRVSANEVAIASMSQSADAALRNQVNSNTSQLSGNANQLGSHASRLGQLESLVDELRRRSPQTQTTVVERVVSQDVVQQVDVPEELVARINANASQVSRIQGLATRLEENTNLLASLSGLAGRVDVLSEQDAILLNTTEDLQAQVAAAMNQANAAMDQANRAIELFNTHNTADNHMGGQHMDDAMVAQLNQRIFENERSVKSLNDLVALLNADLIRQQAEIAQLREGNVPAPVVDVDFTAVDNGIASNRAQIQGIREFVILLRRNQVSLDKRVSALEKNFDGQISGVADDLATLGDRVKAIEDALLTFSGELGAKFQVMRINGANFDADRVFGYDDFKRKSPSSTFSTGNDNDDDDGLIADDRDFTSPVGSSTFSTSLKVKFGFANDTGAKGKPNKLNAFTGAITLKLSRAYGVRSHPTNTSKVYSDAYVFNFADALFYYDPIGADLLTFGFGKDVNVKFSDYVLNTTKLSIKELSDKLDKKGNPKKVTNKYKTPGFVGRLGAPEFLKFLDPSLTVVYVSPDFASGSPLGSDTYVTGIRGEMAPDLVPGFQTKGGVSFATVSHNTRELGDENKDDITTTVFGVDGTITYDPFSVSFVFANASRDEAGNAKNPDPISAFYVTLGTAKNKEFDLAIFTLRDLKVSYRDIAKGWKAYDSGKKDNTAAGNPLQGVASFDGLATASGAFDEDQAGIRVNAKMSLFIFDIDAYFDQYYISGAAGSKDRIGTSAFGLDADINVFAAFAVTGFFHSASVEEKSGGPFAVVDNVKGSDVDGDKVRETRTSGNSPKFLTSTTRDGKNYDTGFGIGIKHNGASDNALINGLNASFEFAQIHAGFDTTRIKASADYTLDIAFLNLTPYASFESLSDPDKGTEDTTTIQVGTGIKTDTFDILFKPSLEGVVNYRSRSYAYDDSKQNYTASQLQFSVGLALNEFLLPHSVLTARYGNFLGTNTAVNPASVFKGENRSGKATNTAGYEITWDYYDLEFAYGIYTNDDDSTDKKDPVTSQTFRIKYKVTF